MAKRKQSTFERLTSGKLNRKQRKILVRKLNSDDPGLAVVNTDVAGIDVGNQSHFVAVPPERDAQPVREFGSWTMAIAEMVRWLHQCGIKRVVMQSTGVYWIALFDSLERAGFEVCLANARDTKNLPGRKSDVQESQWLQKLHTYGLLRNSFRPPEEIRAVRTIWRLRDRHVGEASRCIQHMQKALTTMNVQLANTISDISGTTGQVIIRAILKGERDPYKLAQMRQPGIRASEEEIARSLEGVWQPDVLFELQQAVDGYDFCQKQIRECDGKLQKYLAGLADRGKAAASRMATGNGEEHEEQEGGDSGKKTVRRKPRKNQPQFDLRAELERICGVDLTTIDGVDLMTVQTFVAELGVDMTRWPTENHLVSWLKLAPNRMISGGKLIKHEATKSRSRVADALRMAASTLKASDSYLGARFRQFRARLGPTKGIKAMAAHLARLMYRMLTKGQAWVDRGAAEYQQRRVERERRSLQRKAAELGFYLTPAAV